MRHKDFAGDSTFIIHLPGGWVRLYPFNIEASDAYWECIKYTRERKDMKKLYCEWVPKSVKKI